MERFSFLFLIHLLLTLWIDSVSARIQVPPLATACETISNNYIFTNCTKGVYYTPKCYCNSQPWLGSMALCITDNSDNDIQQQRKAWHHLETYYCISQPDSIANLESMEAILHNATGFVGPVPNDPTTDLLQTPIRFPIDKLALIIRSNQEFNNQLQYGLNYGGASCALVFGLMVLGMVNNLFHHCFSWRYNMAATTRKKARSIPASLSWIKTIRQYIINPMLFMDGVHLQNASWFGVLVSYPTRLESIAIFLFVALNIGLLFPNYDLFVENTLWPNDTAAQLARYIGDRSGEMSFAQLPMIYLFGGRNNIMIWLTGWSYDRFIVAHKWVSRVMVIHAIIHTVAYTWYTSNYGFEMFIVFFSEPYLLWGVAATLLCVSILLFALPNLRRSCYDLFLYSHIILVLVFTVACWYHVALIDDEENMVWLYISIFVWSFDRVARLARVIYYNIMLTTGQRWVRTVEADIIPGTDCIRFRVDADKVGLSHRTPGVFVYIYVPGVYFWQSHPFTIASWHQLSDNTLTIANKTNHYGTMATTSNNNNNNNSKKSHRSNSGNTFDLLIRPQQGMTKKLFHAVEKLGPDGGKMEVLIEGPYGHTHPLLQYDTAILVCGGVGCTATVPYLQEAVYKADQIATRHLVFLWVVQYDDQLSWAQEDIQECLNHINQANICSKANDETEETTRCLGAPLVLDVVVYVTRSTRSQNDSDIVKKKKQGWNVVYGTRPDLDKVLGQYIELAPGSVAMLHCGPDRMGDQIRQISARFGIPYFEEAFNW
ncbi:ferric reductase like transmembrane component-domain-containing protein [Chlamydoabsidia padenii]|nr:ferric reductase like transmembrane component-domain-containing protein [Chlamydoabsidia padenii]